MIEAIQPLAAAPIDFDLIDRAGAPGTIGRVAVFHTLQILSERPCFAPRGRGPIDYDWLGFLREIAHRTIVSGGGDADNFLADALGYMGPNGLPFDVACSLLTSWGMRAFDHVAEKPCRPGDMVIFDMPGAHGAMLISDSPTNPNRTAWAAPDDAIALIAQSVYGRPPSMAWYAGAESRRHQQWFTWSEG